MKGSELYDALIIEHSRSPVNFFKQSTAQHQFEAYNPFCGDQYKLYFDLVDGKVKKVSFHGYGCAVSKAATSVLVQHLDQVSLEEAISLAQDYLNMVKQHSPEPFRLKGVEVFAKASHFPGREQCASLSWEHLLEYLRNVPK